MPDEALISFTVCDVKK